MYECKDECEKDRLLLQIAQLQASKSSMLRAFATIARWGKTDWDGKLVAMVQLSWLQEEIKRADQVALDVRLEDLTVAKTADTKPTGE